MGIYEEVDAKREDIRKRIRETVDFLEAKGVLKPEVGVILGSGLNDYADVIENPVIISYNDIPNMHAGNSEGHRGQLIYGTHMGKKVAILAGRLHYYETGSMESAVFPARVLAALGIRRMIITNAAGGISPELDPGSLMLISDHINLSGANPLIGRNLDEFGPRFPDMSYTYNKELRDALKERAAEEGIILKEGVYMMLSGPTFETPAEIRAYKIMGADAVGMSSVPEAIIANHAGLEVIGISCITNKAAGILDQPLTSEEVQEAAGKVHKEFIKVIDMAIAL